MEEITSAEVHFMHLQATLNYPDDDRNRPWTSPTIPPLTGPNFNFHGLETRQEKREAYWRDILELRNDYLPASLNRLRILTALARSGPNLTLYPRSHKYYAENEVISRIERPAKIVTDSRNPISGASIDPHIQLPDVERLWIIFIIGARLPDQEPVRTIHYSIPRSLYQKLQYIRVHSWVPEWNFPGHDAHRFFWYGHPQYVGPEPPQEWLDASIRRLVDSEAPPSPSRNIPVAATRTAVPVFS
jgi:hypothetical protein